MYQRSSGLLLHVTSLPGPHGIGDLGDEAFAFARMLEHANQHIWQVLPLGPAGAGNSPYDSRSSFAGNPLMINLHELVRDGLLDPDDVPATTRFSRSTVEFGRVRNWKRKRLESAFERFQLGTNSPLHSEYEAFVSASGDWLNDFALYQALKDAHNSRPWYRWPYGIRRFDRDEVERWRRSVSRQIEYYRFEQFLFDLQWKRLKRYANSLGIAIMGDVPIYVALDSADVWGNQEQFLLDEDSRPSVQAGVPPDLFSADGQLWGNPVYEWDRMAADDYSWWRSRIARTFDLTDIVRVDHFRGFAAGWQVPAGASTARTGEWIPGPGRALFDSLAKHIGELPIIVEDLGVITPDVEALRDDLGYPGMKVLQFAFDRDPKNPYLPHNAVPVSMVYTGTHDNDTTSGWYQSLAEADRVYARRYARGRDETIHWDMLRLAWSSVSVLACAPVQDVIGLDGDARMNVPGIARGNWSWRLDSLDPLTRRAAALRDLTELYGRVNAPVAHAAGDVDD